MIWKTIAGRGCARARRVTVSRAVPWQVSFRLKPQELLVAIGKVGCGKSALLQVSTRILGKRTAPLLAFSYFYPRPAWFHPNILVLAPRPS